jgi:hypothetical protein
VLAKARWNAALGRVGGAREVPGRSDSGAGVGNLVQARQAEAEAGRRAQAQERAETGALSTPDEAR